jgi:TRAP-type C4-dicarboxylate transport system permease small subunit
MAVCAVLAWYSLRITIADATGGAMDIRSFDSPRWILIACMPLGFGLMVIEFGRFLLGYDDLFEGATAFE